MRSFIFFFLSLFFTTVSLHANCEKDARTTFEKYQALRVWTDELFAQTEPGPTDTTFGEYGGAGNGMELWTLNPSSSVRPLFPDLNLWSEKKRHLEELFKIEGISLAELDAYGKLIAEQPVDASHYYKSLLWLLASFYEKMESNKTSVASFIKEKVRESARRRKAYLLVFQQFIERALSEGYVEGAWTSAPGFTSLILPKGMQSLNGRRALICAGLRMDMSQQDQDRMKRELEEQGHVVHTQRIDEQRQQYIFFLDVTLHHAPDNPMLSYTEGALIPREYYQDESQHYTRTITDGAGYVVLKYFVK